MSKITLDCPFQSIETYEEIKKSGRKRKRNENKWKRELKQRKDKDTNL